MNVAVSARCANASKTPGAKASGVFVAVLISLSALLSSFILLAAQTAACPVPDALPSERVQVVAVHDGDSVRLADGRRVRLIGINAPELARDGRAAEALALDAGHALRQAVSGKEVRLFYDRDRKDHYGRTLAYLYLPDGQSLEAELLRQGLAFHIGVAPNLALANCLAASESEARRAERGVWGHSGWAPKPASTLATNDTGYQRVSGRIVDVSQAGSAVWLELDGPLVVRVPIAAWSALEKSDLKPGAEVEVRGWVVDRSGTRAARRGFKPLVINLQSHIGLERRAPPL
ncbi:thermonuclease family protein [Marinimicrobium sp. ARAG 43.8]|uniref:thermonuclease family protein n=1 Tax=Marinimicrobium sp. ARAG 43.8 TaxID=3418719 RepID=UPI003CEDE213